MADHTVILTYNVVPGQRPTFSANPGTIHAKAGQTMEFLLAGNMPGTSQLKFENHHLFSSPFPHFDTSGIHEGEGVVTVRDGVTLVSTSYHCSLLGPEPDRRVLAESHETGGLIEPDQGR